jgi:hypothetical protein
MQDDAKKTNQSGKTDSSAGSIDELPQKQISDRDAQSIKGGSARFMMMSRQRRVRSKI